MSKTCCILVLIMCLLISDRLYLTLNGFISWLDWLYFLAFIKLLITLFKYIPQVYLNYKRKNTHGWSIGTVLFDLFGGIFSVAQMILLAWDHNDWSALSGNITKLILGLFSMLFDVLFIVQHFCLYG